MGELKIYRGIGKGASYIYMYMYIYIYATKSMLKVGREKISKLLGNG